jgi:hypothetical protein
VRRSVDYNEGTERILFISMVSDFKNHAPVTRATCIQFSNFKCGMFLGSKEIQNTAVASVPPLGRTKECKPLKLGFEAGTVSKWAHSNKESIWESFGTMRDWKGTRVSGNNEM